LYKGAKNPNTMTRSAAELLARAEESDRSVSEVWEDLQALGDEVDLSPDEESDESDREFTLSE